MLTQKRFAQLFDNYIDDVISFLYTYTSNKALVKDWSQEVFIKMWDKRETINFDHPNFKSYLLKTARNHALKKLKRGQKYEHWLEENLEQLTKVDPKIILCNDDPAIQKAHKAACTKIPLRARRAYLLRREEELTYAEIAEVMDISVKTVESHISKALIILRKELRTFK